MARVRAAGGGGDLRGGMRIPAVAALWIAIERTHGDLGFRLVVPGQCRDRYEHYRCDWLLWSASTGYRFYSR